MNAIGRRLLEGMQERLKTMKELSQPYERDPIAMPLPDHPDEWPFTGAPSLRFRLRQRTPNPKREL